MHKLSIRKRWLEKIEKSIPRIALNVSNVDNGKFYTDLEKIYPAYVWKLEVWWTNYSFNDSKWSRIGLYCSNKTTKLSTLLRGITSTHNVDFYPLICLYSFRTKKKLESHKNFCRNKDCYSAGVLCEKSLLLKFTQFQKSGKAPFFIYADLKSLINNTSAYQIIPKNHPQQK